MNTLFSDKDADAILQRINTLNSGSQALWGSMSVAQMLTHCQRPIQSGLGDLKTKRHWVGKLLGGFFKKQFITSMTWKKSLQTDPNFIVKNCGSFEEEKEKLVQLISRFKASKELITKDPHPFFGKMSPDEWGILQYNHLHHHLSQFGA